MTGQVVGMLKDMFLSLLGYMQSIFDSVDASGYIVAGFIICTITALFIIPLRGHSLGGSSFGGFTRNVVSSAKSSNKSRK